MSSYSKRSLSSKSFVCLNCELRMTCIAINYFYFYVHDSRSRLEIGGQGIHTYLSPSSTGHNYGHILYSDYSILLHNYAEHIMQTLWPMEEGLYAHNSSTRLCKKVFKLLLSVLNRYSIIGKPIKPAFCYACPGHLRQTILIR